MSKFNGTTPKTLTKNRNFNHGCGDGMKTENFSNLMRHGLDNRVASKLDDIFKSGKVAYTDLDDRALDALRQFSVYGALAILDQFLISNLEHVSNKSAYLCGIMKGFRQKSRDGQVIITPMMKNGNKLKGPNSEKIREILERTGYKLDVTTGQRKFGPPTEIENSSPKPQPGCEIFCGRIPKEVYEDELIPLFELCGKIWDLRLMMDPLTGVTRGYAFITFDNSQSAKAAVEKLNNYEIRKEKFLRVNISIPNLRLFIGNIPKSKTKEEIKEEFGRLTAGLVDVIIYNSPDEKKNNRGFCFLEYQTHKAASVAKRCLSVHRMRIWSCDIIVDWADPLDHVDEEIMKTVQILFVRNLTKACSEEVLMGIFGNYGKIERVKKIKNYAFVHFEVRDNAILAMRSLNGFETCKTKLEIMLATPPGDKKKKEEILRARERRMTHVMQNRPDAVSMHVTQITLPNLSRSAPQPQQQQHQQKQKPFIIPLPPRKVECSHPPPSQQKSFIISLPARKIERKNKRDEKFEYNNLPGRNIIPFA